ncbi:MAG: hypothetical protein KAQ85_08715 [Thermodesulfovibrionia bacterium]|nr:hypothetical protein [Thermodesulfovibrionia bacterium]
MSRRTNVSKHSRKGTSGVKRHSREISSRESRIVSHETTYRKLYAAVYTKANTKAKLIKIVNANPTNPPVDMSETGRGPYGTPEEIREYLGSENIILIGPRNSYRAGLSYDNGKWSVD